MGGMGYKPSQLPFQALSADERAAMEKQLVTDCKGKEGASDDDEKLLFERELPSTKEGKCLHACIMEAIGLVSCDSALWP